MFERIRDLWTGWRYYRRARKTGLSHEEALEAMIGHRFDAALGVDHEEQSDQDDLGLDDDVTAYLTDPAGAFYDASGEDDDAWFGGGPFDVTDVHLALLRQVRFGWDGAERGAPMLDPRQPYGTAKPLEQIGRLFEAPDMMDCARYHVEMWWTLNRLLQHGTLAPGRYNIKNLASGDIRDALDGYNHPDGLSDADMGLDRNGGFNLSDEHVRLLRNIEVRWPSEDDCEDRIADGQYPSATCDSKRPYGDMTYIEIDMARILDLLPPEPEGDEPAEFNPDPELAEHLQRLHWQMLGAMQVFVENAELAPGTYE